VEPRYLVEVNNHWELVVKVKVKVKVKFSLEQSMKAQRGSRGLALTLALDGDGWSTPRPGRFTPGKDPVPIVYEAGWAPGPVWTGVKNLAPTGIRSPDRPARSESLYRLSYPGPRELVLGNLNLNRHKIRKEHDCISWSHCVKCDHGLF
jgi:hypothetical protein